MKKILLLFAAGLILLNMYQPAQAAEVSGVISTNNQITSLLDQIVRLKSMIVDLVLKKEVASQAYSIVNILDGSLIAEKNSDKVYPIASVTKLMNAVISIENINMDTSIALNSQILAPEGHSPSLYLNLQVTAKNLLKASLIQSTNDASQALSYFIGNEKFIQLMNQKAQELGMANTYFYDVHGLSTQNRSNSTDLTKLLAYIYQKHPEILRITKDNDFWLPDSTGRLLKFQNVNNFYQEPDFLGAKSGYLPEAKQTLAGIAVINGKPVAIALLRSTNRKTDALTMVRWIKNLSLIQ